MNTKIHVKQEGKHTATVTRAASEAEEAAEAAYHDASAELKDAEIAKKTTMNALANAKAAL